MSHRQGHSTAIRHHFAIPMLFVLTGLVVGIVCHTIAHTIVICCAAAGAMLCCVGYLRPRLPLFGIGMWLLLVATGWFVTNSKIQHIKQGASDCGGYRNMCLLTSGKQSGARTSYGAYYDGHEYIINMPADSSFRAGDFVWVKGTWNATHTAPKGEMFDYQHYLFTNGVSATCYVNGQQMMRSARRATLGTVPLLVYAKIRACHAREALLAIFARIGMSGNELAVVQALTLGYRNDIDSSLRESYVRSGVMHVLAVSGLHVGVIYLVLSWLLTIFGGYRVGSIVRFIILAVILCAYAFVTGLPASVIRAVLMLLIISFGNLIERGGNSLNTLCLTAFIVLMADPLALYTVSFQLSYCATAAICLAMPWLSEHEPDNTIMRWLWYSIGMSIAANMASIPLTLHHFSGFSAISLLTSLIVIPLAEAVVIMSILLFCLCWSSIMAHGCATALTALLGFQNSIVSMVEHWSLAYIDSWLSLTECVLMLIAFAYLLTILYSRNRYKTFIISCCVLVLFLACRCRRVMRHSERVIIENRCVVAIKGERMLICAEDSMRANKVADYFTTKYNIRHITYRIARNSGFEINGTRWVVANDSMLRYMRFAEPWQCDNLVAGRQAARMKCEELMNIFRTDTIRIMPSFSAYRRDELERTCAEKGIAILEH